MSEIHARFGATSERMAILQGLLDYRKALVASGTNQGYQFVDGSFVEECETLRGVPPNDVDVITFAYVKKPKAAKRALLKGHPELFDPDAAKAKYKCHAFFVDLTIPGHSIVAQTCYYFGLLSHQRVTALWKGLLAVSLQSDDDKVTQALSAAEGTHVT